MHDRQAIKPAILLVDDHPANLITLEAVLGTSEYRLICAASGAEALAVLEVEEIALILLDVQMPGIDGYEVLRRVKSSERTKHIPVILITAIYTEDPHVRKGYEVGAIDYFAKPFNPDLLRQKVSIYAELYTNNLILRRREEERREMELKLHALHQSIEVRERERRAADERRAAELRTVLESIPDAVYVGDENGITRFNSAALEMFGLSERQELAEHFETLARSVKMRYVNAEEPIPATDLPYAHALRGEQFVCELKVRHFTSGEDVVIACAASPVILGTEIIGAVVVNIPVPQDAGDHRLIPGVPTLRAPVRTHPSAPPASNDPLSS